MFNQKILLLSYILTITIYYVLVPIHRFRGCMKTLEQFLQSTPYTGLLNEQIRTTILQNDQLRLFNLELLSPDDSIKSEFLDLTQPHIDFNRSNTIYQLLKASMGVSDHEIAHINFQPPVDYSSDWLMNNYLQSLHTRIRAQVRFNGNGIATFTANPGSYMTELKLDHNPAVILNNTVVTDTVIINCGCISGRLDILENTKILIETNISNLKITRYNPVALYKKLFY